jgi:hypothetical protein
MTNPSDVPEAASRRLGSAAFSSGLNATDFAACLQMGLQPVGLVQGFCAMQWGWYGAGSPYGRGLSPFGPSVGGGYQQNWYCPHGFVGGEHRTWGQNFEQTWIEDAWQTGFSAAFNRMLEEAKAVDAHGIIGVTDTSHHLADTRVIEFHLLGTAVVVEGGPAPPGGTPWSTYLAGQRLAKLIEAGFMPVSVVAAMASVRVWAYCVTEFLMEGGTYGWGASMGSTAEIEQVSEARLAARVLAREQARKQLGTDSLQGIVFSATEREVGSGDQVIECLLRGTRVRQFKDFDPLPTPRPTVRLS